MSYPARAEGLGKYDIEKYLWWVRPCFSISAQYALFNVLLYSHINHKRYTYAKTQSADSNTQATSLFRYERLLTSWLLSSVLRHEERDTQFLKVFRNHSTLTNSIEWLRKTFKTTKCLVGPDKRAAHPVVFKISVGRDLQNSMVKLQLLNTMVLTQLLLSICMAQVNYQLDRSPFDNQLDWSPVNYQLDCPTVETQLTCFSKYPNSQPISSGHDVIHTPVTFPILGLLWQLWLLYPPRTSVNCT